MSKRVIMTGATGFIGSAILAELLARGDRVTLLQRPGSSGARLAGIHGFESHTYTELLNDETVLKLKNGSPDIFIHCAWRGVGGQDRNHAFQITDNIPLTLATVELASASGCRQWIGMGSQAEYGNQNRRLDEEAPLRPTTLYGKAKLAAGVAALALCEARNIAGSWLRIFSTYGPEDAPHWFLPYVIQEFLAGRAPKLTKCEQLWDYLYVADGARAVCAVANGSTGGVFNLGAGCSVPLKEYVEAIRSELDSSLDPVYGAVPYRPDQVMHLEADITRLTTASGWRPEIDFVDGIRKTIAFECLRRTTAAKGTS